MDISSNIRSLRKAARLTQEELADKVGVTRTTVTQWETGYTKPRIGTVKKLAEIFNCQPNDILDEVRTTGSSIYSTTRATVPLTSIGRVHAGELVDEETIEDNVEVPARIFDAHPNAFALTVEGTCMNKVIPEGAHILVDPTVQPHNGSIVVIENENYQAILRRFYRGSSTLMLSADSYEQFEDILLDENSGSIRLVGTVVWFQSSEELS